MNVITEEMMNDLRLFPLFCDITKLLLQLFILEIKDNSSAAKTYKIIYGLCIRTNKEEISNEIFCSDFYKIYASGSKTYSISKVSVYNYPSIIIELVNGLLSGQSLKDVAEEKLENRKIGFDAFYTKEFSIRPVIFNETNTLISRNPYEKNALVSPYKDVPSFTLAVCCLNKIGIIFKNNEVDNSALLAILKYLQTETTFPFLTSGCIRFGNIEFINTQCVDEFEVGYIDSEVIKEIIKVDYKEEIVCKKLTISINSNIYTCSKRLLINCFLKNGEQVILDECKEVFHKKNQKLTITFESEEQIGSISISIWKEENEAFQIWYKYSVTLCRQLGLNMGIVGLYGTVKSDWLSEIEKTNSKAKEKVAKAEKVSKTSYQKLMAIGKYTLDPWVEEDRSFSRYIKQINPEKTDAEFFPQGWNEETNEYGSISFLEWFKKQTQDAQQVVIQDPFYDTLGLEFLVRTTNAETDFMVLTCTQVKSTDDNKNIYYVWKSAILDRILNIFRSKKRSEKAEPNRAIRIKSFIRSNPSLFDSLRLNINDLRSVGGGETNLLHDRYILIFKEKVLKKGFHLSNSIQGATKKQPLLITPIPQDVLQKIDNHLNDLINKTTSPKNITKIISLYNYENTPKRTKENNETEKIADQELYERFKQDFKQENSVSKELVEDLISKALVQRKFPEFWATLGYFLASTNYSDKIVFALKGINNLNFAIELRKYIESSITAKYPLGFSEKLQRREYDFQFLFFEDFKRIIENILRLNGCISEIFGHGNWGVYYGCNLLLDVNFDEYIALVKFIENQYKENGSKALANASLSKLSSILFTQLLISLFWENNTDNLIKKLFDSKISYMRAIAASVVVADILEDKPCMAFDNSKKILLANLSIDESLHVFIVCLLNLKFRTKDIDTTLESEILSTILLILRKNYTNERLQNIFKQILYSNYPFIEKKITEDILLQLEDVGLMSTNDIFKLWSDEFLILLDNFESKHNYLGVIDIAGCSFQFIDNKVKDAFVKKLNKRLQKELSEIRKPFRKETKVWNMSFKRVLLIKTLLMIVVLYIGKDNCYEEMQIIGEIDKLEKKHQYHGKFCNIYNFSCRIGENYQSIL